MSAQSRYFPSIYDDNSSSSADIWFTLKQNHVNLNLNTQPQQQVPTAVQSETWPDGNNLAVPEYRPLEVFSPSVDGPYMPWSEGDDICELAIRLKEIELGALVGDSFDTIRYVFLSTVQYDKVQQIRRRK